MHCSLWITKRGDRAFNGAAFNSWGRRSVELDSLCRLLEADSPSDDLRLEVVLTLDGRAGHSSQKSDLPDVRERIGDWTLKQFFGSKFQRCIRSEAVVELPKRVKESRNLLLPGQRRRVAPNLLPFGETNSPLEQIADVCEDLAGCSSSFPGTKLIETFRRIRNGFGAAIRKRSDRVPQQLS